MASIKKLPALHEDLQYDYELEIKHLDIYMSRFFL